jgi:hypothetical protein
METHKEHLFKKVGLPTTMPMSKKQLSVLFKVPLKALHEVYKRGIGAWKTNISSVRLQKDFSKNPDMGKYPRSKRLPKEAWAMARIYSFLDKGKTYHTADADIAKKYGV